MVGPGGDKVRPMAISVPWRDWDGDKADERGRGRGGGGVRADGVVVDGVVGGTEARRSALFRLLPMPLLLLAPV